MCSCLRSSELVREIIACLAHIMSRPDFSEDRGGPKGHAADLPLAWNWLTKNLWPAAQGNAGLAVLVRRGDARGPVRGAR